MLPTPQRQPASTICIFRFSANYHNKCYDSLSPTFGFEKPQTYREVARRIQLDLSAVNSLPWLAFSNPTYIHSLFCWTIWGTAVDRMPFLLQILQHACPKNKDILLRNHNIILHSENVALIDYITKCPYSNFHNCSIMSLLTIS